VKVGQERLLGRIVRRRHGDLIPSHPPSSLARSLLELTLYALKPSSPLYPGFMILLHYAFKQHRRARLCQTGHLSIRLDLSVVATRVERHSTSRPTIPLLALGGAMGFAHLGSVPSPECSPACAILPSDTRMPHASLCPTESG
jgi:hypothetical protein